MSVENVSAPIVILCGHYGAGKTNLAVNLALEEARSGKEATVVDLDVVNPYFRSADFQELFLRSGVRLIAPVYANSNLDLPVLPPSVASAIRSGERVILDVGGDDDGAVALGGFSALLRERGYAMLYVVNMLRELEPDPGEEAELLRQIERCSRLEVTYLVNNTNLGPETTPQVIARSKGYLEELSRITGLPVLFTTAEESFAASVGEQGVKPVRIYVKPPWEEGEKR